MFLLDIIHMAILAYAYPAFVNLVNRSTSDETRGTALGMVLGVSSLLAIPTAVLGAWAYERFGRLWSFGATAVVVFGLAAVGLWQTRGVKADPRSQPAS